MSALRLRLTLALGASLAAGLAGACARQGVPPGGPEDRRPPVVIATYPDTFAVLTEPFRGPVRFEFDERVSERVSSGTMAQAVVVSPRSGEVRVKHGRQSIEVEMQGGFKPGKVYRVTLLPVIQDLFNNKLLAPFELVFSTGGEFNPSAVAGTAWDRITAEGVDALEVLAIPADPADSVPHVARTDTAGVYVFRYLPAGSYNLWAYQDRNRNGRVDPMELQGVVPFQLAGADTTFVDVPVLQPDTTPAELIRAVVVDSVTVLLEFDDHLEPLSAAALMGVTLTRNETGALIPLTIMHEREYVAWAAQIQDSFARLDSLEAARRAEDALEDVPLSGDTATQDSTVAPPPPDSAAAGAPAGAPAPGPVVAATRPIPPALPRASSGGRPQASARPPGSGPAPEELTPDGRPLPSRRLVLRLDEFLIVNEGYQVLAGSVVNINGISGGGGESAVVREPPPEPDSAAVADSLAALDSAGVDPDTTGVAGDTVPASSDSVLAPPDTGGVVPRVGKAEPFLPAFRRR